MVLVFMIGVYKQAGSVKGTSGILQIAIKVGRNLQQIHQGVNTGLMKMLLTLFLSYPKKIPAKALCLSGHSEKSSRRGHLARFPIFWLSKKRKK